MWVSLSPTTTMSGKSDSDSAVSDSLLRPARLTSTPRASRGVDGRQLNESGIARALDLTVSTIIEREAER